APPSAVSGCARRSLRSHARINPSTQPSDVAGGSRSKALELALIVEWGGFAAGSCAALICFALLCFAFAFAFVGASLLAKAACRATHFSQMPTIQL
ncbi:hypothetical protein, partial [Pseudomonas sp.]|uniref:hypothetical protein n=1 Tax=Pseudomonas sp. TaxID=306 RepID=UPI003341AD42